MSEEIKNGIETVEIDIKASKKAKRTKRIKIILISFVAAFLVYHIAVMPVATAVVYEMIFGGRYEADPWMDLSVEDFEGLEVERSDFSSDGVTLAGYCYSKEGQEVSGVVVISHGFGCGGQRVYMAFADYFTSNGYLVFAYDARGNDESEGDSAKGLPQGITDLDNALKHVKSEERYAGLPIALLGHSWGGYSVGNVLGKHPDVKAAVIISGFNESEDMIEHKSLQYAGVATYFAMPYLKLYEFIKFGGEISNMTALEEMGKTEAGIMIVHSKDDPTVPTKYSYDKYFEAYGDTDRFEFILYEDRGHSTPYYSDAAREYRQLAEADYLAYLEENGKSDSAIAQEEYISENLDKKRLHELDPELMARVMEMLDEYCK